MENTKGWEVVKALRRAQKELRYAEELNLPNEETERLKVIINLIEELIEIQEL